MYQLSLEINGNTLIMSYQQGYLISTVDGLTGVTSRLDTVQAASGIGDAYTGGTVQGLPITIRGKILDHNVAAKQALIDTAVPLGEGTLTVYNIDANRITPYRKIDVIVRVSPVITQEKHAKFTLSLYAPSPIWYGVDYTTVQVQNTGTVAVTNEGQYPAEYEMRIVTNDYAKNIYLYLDGTTQGSPRLHIDLTKYDSDGYAGIMKLARVRGKVYFYLGSSPENRLGCIDPDSDFWAIPMGAHNLSLRMDVNGGATITFKTPYAGVVLSGI